jgi:hypothetical protein
MYRQVSWLAALALPVRLPDAAGPKPVAVSVALWGKLAAYSCGGSLGVGSKMILTVFPFHPLALARRGEPIRFQESSWR